MTQTAPSIRAKTPSSGVTAIGVVVIGRNEGERLRRCLASLQRAGSMPLVYVDSGSTDDSVAIATGLGVDVVHLDMSRRFTAARARNAGLARLRATHPGLSFVQFVDGDCEIDPGWFEHAATVLADDPGLAIVCGRLRERHREASVYNRLCDMEWAEPPGEATWCGGIFLARMEAIVGQGGFRDDMIAGEEPELCVRLRRDGWRIRRVSAEMATHDAAMTRFRQWWRRCVRGGHAFAHGAWLHGRSRQRHWVRESRRTWFWGVALPALILLASWPTAGLSFGLSAGYLVLGYRVYRHQRARGHGPADARLYAAFCVLGKFPEALGQMQFHFHRLLRHRNPAVLHRPDRTDSGGADGREGRQLRVLYLVNQYPLLSHSFIRREIAAVEASGVHVTRVSLRETGPQLQADDAAERERTHVILGRGLVPLLACAAAVALRRPGRFLATLRLAGRCGRSERRLIAHLAYLVEACAVCRLAAAESIDHIHAHFGTNSAAVAMYCQGIGGPPYSVTVHGSEEFDRPEALCLGEKLSRAAFAVAVSSFGRSQLLRWCPHAHWPNIHLVRCGLDPAYLEHVPSPVPDVPHLISVGRLCEQKGQLLLLEAAARLREEHPDFELSLIGDGPMRPALETQIDALELHGCVHLLGSLDNARVREHLLQARAMLLPSFAENLPVVIMEALALGRPVLSTYVAGIPELVEPGVCGHLVPAGDVDALTIAMGKLLETSPDELTRMGQAGAERVRQRHDADKEADKLGELFLHHARLRALAERRVGALHEQDAADDPDLTPERATTHG